MRIALSVIIILLGANFLIELLDSSMVDVIKERNETIQRQIDAMWQSGNCTQNRVFPLATLPNLLSYRQAGNETAQTFSSLIMRKIESQMCAAIHNNQNWSNANTTVHFNEEENISIVRLHGNKIAEIDDNSMTIFDGGWQSTTTKSRLNALCDEFCIAGEGVFQKNYKWFVRKFTGQLGTEKVFTTEDFSNGYIFAWLKLRKSGQRPTLTSIQSS